jgi:2-oxoglutarate dehydrogenase E1 component
MLRPWRKPLVIMTPKSLLRLPAAVSPLEDLTRGGFQRIIGDDAVRPDRARSVLLCSGKIYFELAEERARHGRNDVAILRLEQLYPLYPQTLAQALAPYSEGTPVTWVQEDPENMGAWRYLRVRFGERLLGRHPFFGVHRTASSTPATGSASSHRLEQKQLIAKAFGEPAAAAEAHALRNHRIEG